MVCASSLFPNICSQYSTIYLVNKPAARRQLPLPVRSSSSNISSKLVFENIFFQQERTTGKENLISCFSQLLLLELLETAYQINEVHKKVVAGNCVGVVLIEHQKSYHRHRCDA